MSVTDSKMTEKNFILRKALCIYFAGKCGLWKGQRESGTNVAVTILISSSDKRNLLHAHTQTQIDSPSKECSSIPLYTSVLMAALLHAAVSYSGPVKYRPFVGRDIN